MTEITDEQLAALSAVGRRTLSKAKVTKESRLARQAFEVYLDWLDRVNEDDSDRLDEQMRDVARSFAPLSLHDQDFTNQIFGTYVQMLMEDAPGQGAAYAALIMALRFMFRIGWAIVPPTG